MNNNNNLYACLFCGARKGKKCHPGCSSVIYSMHDSKKSEAKKNVGQDYISLDLKIPHEKLMEKIQNIIENIEPDPFFDRDESTSEEN